VSTSPVAIESILPCLQGVIPSPVATCAADGTPNITYMSIVQYVDSERVALSRQFFRKTATNLDENPNAHVLVVDPETIEQFTLDLRYLHTETTGPAFDAMKANLEAIASHGGVGTSVFRLRGIDIYCVERCERVRPDADFAVDEDPARDALKALDALVARVGAADDYEEATQVALQALEDLFGFPHAMLLVAGGDGDRLFGVASNGYAGSPAGAEVLLGDGVIGIAAQRRQLICMANMARGRVMGSAVQESVGRHAGHAPAAREIPLPGLVGVQSAAAIPLLLHDQLTGVLYLESDRPGRFGPHNERVLRIIGGHVAAVLSALERDRDPGAAGAPAAARSPVAASPPADVLEVAYYQADDSVFAGGEYVIKGVPGRILWKLLREHEADGRTAFTNRELRLDERLGLPAGNDNLEARLVALRRRLEAGDFGMGLERVARGRLQLHVRAALALVEVPTRGVMQAAHRAPDQVA
jgi:adenylate cyclase